MYTNELKPLLNQIAKKNHTTPEEVYQEMQLLLDETWNTADPVFKQNQQQLFPNGKPTVAEFIARLATNVQNDLTLY